MTPADLLTASIVPHSLVCNCFYLKQHLDTNYYRPQRSWAKVIFSQACVKNFVHGGGGVYLVPGGSGPWGGSGPRGVWSWGGSGPRGSLIFQRGGVPNFSGGL